VFGNEVSLERTWTLDLAGQFLRGDMQVEMSNRLGFRALTFWKKTGESSVQVIWLDETGESKVLEGLLDPSRPEVVIHHLDAGDDGSQAWQRIVFRILGRDEYVEVLYAETGGEWREVGEFRFRRTETGTPPPPR